MDIINQDLLDFQELQEKLEQEEKKLWKKLKWHIATQEEMQRYIEIMCLENSPSVEQVPPQICEFDNAVAFVNWSLRYKATALFSRIIKILHIK